MNFKIFEANHNGKRFRIEEDYPRVGTYLYIYENEKCIKDFLQNGISECKEMAYEEYGVEQSEWREVQV